MKRNLIYLLIGVIGLGGLSACSEDESSYPAPTPLTQESIKTESDNGKITIKWEVPADSNYYYVKVQYKLPDTGNKVYTKLASVGTNSMTIDNLLARYGEIEFTLQPFSKDGKGGSICKVIGKADSAPKQVVINGKTAPVELSLSQLSVNSLQTDDGKLEYLVDGDKSTGSYYHGNWGSPIPLPHYIVVDLKKEVYAFNFYYMARDNGNRSNPTAMSIYGSTNFTGTFGGKSDTGFDTEAADATLLTNLSGLPDTRKAEYTSGVIKGSQPFRYVWFKITSTYNNQKFVTLNELEITEHKTSVYDPETGETTDN